LDEIAQIEEMNGEVTKELFQLAVAEDLEA